jgi:hypothetical protein
MENLILNPYIFAGGLSITVLLVYLLMNELAHSTKVAMRSDFEYFKEKYKHEITKFSDEQKLHVSNELLQVYKEINDTNDALIKISEEKLTITKEELIKIIAAIASLPKYATGTSSKYSIDCNGGVHVSDFNEHYYLYKPVTTNIACIDNFLANEKI